MIIKRPVFYDVSHWKEIEDFTKVSPKPLLFGTKATEGTNLVDGKFVRFFSGMNEIGVRRLCYHFHRKAFNPVTQAWFFINTIKPHLSDDDILALDVEEGGETAKQIQEFCETVITMLPHNELWIYSRKNILESIPTFLGALFPHLTDRMRAGVSALDGIQMTLAEREFFKRIPIWTAGYPINPDLYNSVPSFYVPDPTRWGPVYAWQYSAHGQIEGIMGDVDLNWLSPLAIALLEKPTPDVPSIPHPGMKRISGVRHGWHFELILTDPEQVRYEAVCLPAPATVSSVMQDERYRDAVFGCNGGEWDRFTDQLKDYSVHNGIVCVPRTNAGQTSLMITDSNEIIIDYKNAEHVWQAVSGVMPLVQNGQVDPRCLVNTEGHARTCFGVNAVGYGMVLLSEGAYPNQGLTYAEAAELLIEYGAVKAMFASGGGDTYARLDGQGIITPENIDPATGKHFERPVPQVFLIYAKGATNMANGTAKEKLGNPSKKRNSPSRYGTDMGTIPAGSTIEFVKVVPVQVHGTADNVNDQWFELPDHTYVNYILAGMAYYTILTQPTPEPLPAPTPTFPPSMEHTAVFKDEQGAEVATYKGILTKQ